MNSMTTNQQHYEVGQRVDVILTGDDSHPYWTPGTFVGHAPTLSADYQMVRVYVQGRGVLSLHPTAVCALGKCDTQSHQAHNLRWHR